MFLFLSLVSCSKFAILFAGSKDWKNYRHQADVFYMYKILKDHGFQDDHISLWAYNDIVYNDLNPYKGQIFHTLNNSNIYPGDSKIDFKGDEVNGPNFVSYLKELNTTSEDDIYLYYNDHGAPNIVAAPVGNPMTTYQLANTIETMNKLKKFRHLFFVVEACYSGCFKDSEFPDNVAIITAAQCTESSYSAIRNRWVDGNYMSNEFSAHTFLEIESNPHHTVQSLFDAVKSKMQLSTPTIIGNLRDVKISDFIGVGPKSSIRRQAFSDSEENQDIVNAVINAPRHIREAYNRFEDRQVELTNKLAESIRSIVKIVAGNRSDYFMEKIEDSDVEKCYSPVIERFFTKFGEFNQDDGHLIMPLKALCAKFDAKPILEAIEKVL